MADILTNLRELSFIYGMHHDESDVAPDVFLSRVTVLTSVPDNVSISSNQNHFTDNEKNTISNGIRLAKSVISSGVVEPRAINITWLGNIQDGQPFDVRVNDIAFSLKEKSFILKNMGLYAFLNILTGASYSRGTNAFEEFSKQELNDWFCNTRNLIIKYLNRKNWLFEKRDNTYEMKLQSNDLYLSINSEQVVLEDFCNCTYDNYKIIKGKFKEKVVSKFIEKNLQSDVEYLKYKRDCSIKAGESIVKFIENNFVENENMLTELFGFSASEEYYYAKVTDNDVDIRLVPMARDNTLEVEIKSIESSVPVSQLNIVTKIKIEGCDGLVILINEIRYIHGQFNGIPEAKLYYDSQSDLPYKKIYKI